VSPTNNPPAVPPAAPPATPPAAPRSASAAHGAPGPVIVQTDAVTKAFTSPDGSALPVLEDVSLTLREGEIVALLGKSGSGKSTLLRCIAGLIAPSSGTVSYRGTPLNGANPGAAMVFQSFALLPWLTVQQNVELAMQARGVPEQDLAPRALRAIDLIGLDGFESAYPKELSGGMRQRVGFARALVVEPDALLMDEPFSALDVLTASNLRGELTRLWEGREFPVKAVLMVTHNIEEAVQLADRILVLSSNPGRIMAELTIDLPRPRDRRDPVFDGLVDTVYDILTGREEAAEAAVADTAPTPADLPLPEVSAGGLSGLLEILSACGGENGLAELAEDFNFEIDDLLPLVDAAEMLAMAEVIDARIRITDAGRSYAAADIDTGKHLFASAAAKHAPLVGAIVKALEATDDGSLREGFFLDLLRRGFSAQDARRQLDTAIDWGRYAELFEYDAEHGEIILERSPRQEADAPARRTADRAGRRAGRQASGRSFCRKCYGQFSMSLVDEARTTLAVTRLMPRALIPTCTALTVSVPGPAICSLRIRLTPRTLIFVFGAMTVGLAITTTLPTLRYAMVALPVSAAQVLADCDCTAPTLITGTPARPILVLSTDAWATDTAGPCDVVTLAHRLPELIRPESVSTHGGATVSAAVVAIEPVSGVGLMFSSCRPRAEALADSP